MRKFLVSRWFLIALAAALTVGMVGGTRLKWFSDHKLLRDAAVAVSLFLMALPLEPRVIWKTLRNPRAPLLAVVVTYGILPPVAWLVSWLLNPDLAQGLLIASTTPCTMASASVWTRRAGGNDAVSTLVTIITNAGCFLFMPIWLAVMFGSAADTVSFSFVDSVVSLGKLVVAPMVAAQIVRRWRPVAEFATRRKVPLGVLVQCGILHMVLCGAIEAGHRLFGAEAQTMRLVDLVLMLGAVLAVHLSMFWTGLRLAAICGVSRADQIAVGFAGSQKTLMIGLKIALDMQVSILPMVSFHVTQLLVDTLIADRMAQRAAQAGLDPNPSTS